MYFLYSEIPNSLFSNSRPINTQRNQQSLLIAKLWSQKLIQTSLNTFCSDKNCDHVFIFEEKFKSIFYVFRVQIFYIQLYLLDGILLLFDLCSFFDRRIFVFSLWLWLRFCGFFWRGFFIFNILIFLLLCQLLCYHLFLSSNALFIKLWFLILLFLLFRRLWCGFIVWWLLRIVFQIGLSQKLFNFLCVLTQAFEFLFQEKTTFVIRKKFQGVCYILKSHLILLDLFSGKSPSAEGLESEVLMLAYFFKYLHILNHISAVFDCLFEPAKFYKCQRSVRVDRFYVLCL